MESTPRIMLIDEVAAAYRVTVPTVRHWKKQSEKGEFDFPATISVKNGKCRWLASDIEAHILSRAKTVPRPVNDVSPRGQRRERKVFDVRQELARQALAERHGIKVGSETAAGAVLARHDESRKNTQQKPQD